MRIPLYICAPLCLSVIGLTYWLGSKDYDFTTPPDGLAAITDEDISAFDEADTSSKSKEKAQLAKVETPKPPVEVEPEPEEEIPKVVVEQMADSQTDDYLNLTDGGAEGYQQLAEKLVADKYPTHSLVAWERLLDSAVPSEQQVKLAYGILKLHKPVQRPEVGRIAISIKLHASVPGDMLGKMTKVLERSAAAMEQSSGFSINVTPEISVVAVKKGKSRPVVSIWLSGKNETARGNFRTRSANELGVDEKVNITIFNIVGPYLEQHTKLTPLDKMHPEINAQETLSYLITRHSWRELGRLLYAELEQS